VVAICPAALSLKTADGPTYTAKEIFNWTKANSKKPEMPFNYYFAKIRDIMDDPIDLAMVKAINDIGHTMGLKTVAEFVGNEDIVHQLRALGIDYAKAPVSPHPRNR
jgi:hypothetical protein